MEHVNKVLGKNILLEDNIPVKDPPRLVIQNKPTLAFIDVTTQTLGCMGKSDDDEEYDDKVDSESVISSDIRKDEQGDAVETHDDEKVHEMADGMKDGDGVLSPTCLMCCCTNPFSRSVETERFQRTGIG